MSAFMMTFRDCSILGEEIAGRLPGYRGRAEELAAALYTENLASVNARYPDTRYNPAALPGPVDEAGERFRFVGSVACRSGISDVALAKLARCWRYQSCEHDGCEEGEGWQAVAALLETIPNAERLPGWDDAAWGNYCPASDPGKPRAVAGAAEADAVAALMGTATADRPGSSPDCPRTVDGAELSRLMKRALRERFPGVSFRVRGSRGTGYGWFHVYVGEGVELAEVEKVAGCFESWGFDGMTDSSYTVDPTPVQVGGEWVIGSARGVNVSREWRAGK